jgi:tetratricopeptide (TPR) repeat protein
MDNERSAAELLAAGIEATNEAAFRTGDFDAAGPLLEEARRRAEAADDRKAEAGALDQLGWLMHFRALAAGIENADPDAEEALFQRALAIRREIGDQAGIAGSLFGLGLVHQVLRGDWEAAMPCYGEALALAEEHGSDLLRSECHRHVGFFYVYIDGQLEEGIRHLQASLDLRERWGDERWTPSGLLALGQAKALAGRRDEALGHFRESVRRAQAAGLSGRYLDAAEEELRRAEAGEPPAAARWVRAAEDSPSTSA